MGHISTNHIQHMVKSGQLQGIDTLVGTPIFCEACVLGKMKKLPFESQEQPCTTCPLEMVHMDVGGPITPRSWEGYRFWIVIVNDFTHFPWVYFMKHKNEALQIYNQWKQYKQLELRWMGTVEKFAKVGEGLQFRGLKVDLKGICKQVPARETCG